jgi:hypothetical protein
MKPYTQKRKTTNDSAAFMFRPLRSVDCDTGIVVKTKVHWTLKKRGNMKPITQQPFNNEL